MSSRAKTQSTVHYRFSSCYMHLQCGLASFLMQEIGMVYAPPENSKLFGITVKDSNTAGYTFFLYKRTVRDCDTEVRY